MKFRWKKKLWRKTMLGGRLCVVEDEVGDGAVAENEVGEDEGRGG